jgi:hypothetical protein
MKLFLISAVLASAISVAHADLQVNTDYVDFGAVTSTVPGVPRLVTISNRGSDPAQFVQVNSMSCIYPDFYIANYCPSNLMPEQSCEIWIYFQPMHPGLYNCQFVIGSLQQPYDVRVNVTGTRIN